MMLLDHDTKVHSGEWDKCAFVEGKHRVIICTLLDELMCKRMEIFGTFLRDCLWVWFLLWFGLGFFFSTFPLSLCIGWYVLPPSPCLPLPHCYYFYFIYLVLFSTSCFTPTISVYLFPLLSPFHTYPFLYSHTRPFNTLSFLFLQNTLSSLGNFLSLLANFLSISLFSPYFSFSLPHTPTIFTPH